MASLDANTRSYLLHSQLGTNQVNHKDPKIDALWDQLLRAPTPEEWSRLSHEVQRYIVGNMVQMSATTLPFMQAARDQVKGYVFERGFKIRFETTWLDTSADTQGHACTAWVASDESTSLLVASQVSSIDMRVRQRSF